MQLEEQNLWIFEIPKVLGSILCIGILIIKVGLNN
jgi:hypothetical protein